MIWWTRGTRERTKKNQTIAFPKQEAGSRTTAKKMENGTAHNVASAMNDGILEARSLTFARTAERECKINWLNTNNSEIPNS